MIQRSKGQRNSEPKTFNSKVVRKPVPKTYGSKFLKSSETNVKTYPRQNFYKKKSGISRDITIRQEHIIRKSQD